jgi:ADP-L-glycero-D-manno-heptose 6-epimerase
MILITGAAGFIGSCLVQGLNELGREDLVLVDDFSRTDKQANLQGKKIRQKVPRQTLWTWLQAENPKFDWVLHMGARTDTAEQEQAIFDELNLHYSQKLWDWCAAQNIPLIYASSAATYGGGQWGFDDQKSNASLSPLNLYGWSKQHFDLWAETQAKKPPQWHGLKFFNVYGPNEYHKGRMASVIFHTFRQIQATGKMRLFRSHRPDYADGEQKRDFIYVMDLVKVILFLMQGGVSSGLYNLGTGKARSFNDLVGNVFRSLNKRANIEYIDTPLDIRESYQYFTEANMQKLREAGYNAKFCDLEAGIHAYVRQYLSLGKYY